MEKIESLTLKNGETFKITFPATKLSKLKNKNLEFYKKFNEILYAGKNVKQDFEQFLQVIYCSYIVNSNGNLTYDEFIDNFPEEYDNFNSIGYLCAYVIGYDGVSNNKFYKQNKF